mgnify:CR=1 FL=1
MIILNLPQDFLNRIQSQLDSEYPAFLAACQEPRVTGLCTNLLKVTPVRLQQLLPYLKGVVPWCSNGFYFNETAVRPAKDPYYHAGLYYIQEPSAMLPVQLLGVRPGDRVLDLCAAPGGKSVQIAGILQQNGLLVANDLHPQRAKVLLKNMERHGVINMVVTNESPQKLARVFAGFFDKILIDAPCSGEGMFRKEPVMMQDWSYGEVEKYARWQREILHHVPAMLRSGGEIVYSTCTFSPEENEKQIADFCTQFPDFVVTDQKRIWPHRHRGEGHFAAKLVKQMKSTEMGKANTKNGYSESKLDSGLVKALHDFSAHLWGNEHSWRDWLPSHGQVVERMGHVVWEMNETPALKGSKILRSGWLLGIWEKGRFRPSQAFAMGLPEQAVASATNRCDFTTASEAERYNAIRYLRGETIGSDSEWTKGWHLITVDRFPLGWAKGALQGLKNEYPPGWRWED